MVDHYSRNRAVALVGGVLLVAFGAWLWVTAPPGVPSPDFLSAREEQLVWVKGFAVFGLMAFVFGATSALVVQREKAADRLAALGSSVVWLAIAGATVLFAAMRL
jgi:hypothetical protein